ncbi:MAG TPA: phospholipase D-like domain-containing protein [Elusimicrobiota bacterium]|nr:phospholipase D-like domain-containing protein [Elusimicrobiota bacterium]
MKSRFLRVSLSLGLTLSLQAPVLAQVRPILLPSMTAIPGVAGAASISAAFHLGAAPSLLAAPALAPALNAPSLAISPALAAMPSALAAAAPALSAAPAAASAKSSLSEMAAAPAAAPAGAPALAGFSEGRRTFDGAALEGPAPAPADAPAPAPRGDSVAFNGQTLPTRMFSDTTQISSHLIRAIDATKKTLDIAIYELAIREVRDALARAKQRGVKVRIVMDQGHLFPEKSTGKRTPEVQSLVDGGFELKMLRGGDAYGIMHNKFAVFDGALLETGSYNWTRAADVQHFENALFENDATRIASYQNYWNWLWSSAKVVDDKNPPVRPVLDEHGHSAPLPPAPQDAARSVRFNGVALPREAYTPRGTAAEIVKAIDAAKTSLVVANFSFTHADLIEALKRAKDRGVDIRIVFDRYQYGFLKEMAEMADLGFDVRLSNGKDGQKGVMHNKFVVLDGKLVETGSFNWTFNGELNNYENAVFLDAPDDAAAWSAYFERIWKQGRAPTADDHHGRHDAGEGLDP